jgi:hypothetical protein
VAFEQLVGVVVGGKTVVDFSGAVVFGFGEMVVVSPGSMVAMILLVLLSESESDSFAYRTARTTTATRRIIIRTTARTRAFLLLFDL